MTNIPSDHETETTPDTIPGFDLRSDDVAKRRADALRSIVPEAFTEQGLDLDVLRRTLGEVIDNGPERFGLTWPGKAQAMQVVRQPSVGTLIPRPDESVDWDTTGNVIIEGDNLEVLKLLQKSYYGKVKMIYIDPPYNTGRRFSYPDKFGEGLRAYLHYTNQVDGDGMAVQSAAETQGRHHSNWLSMMYSRLYLARNLLSDNGAIFVSIDDREVHHLRSLLSDVFGEENYICTMVWNTEGHTDNQFQIKNVHEYVHVYAKSITGFDAGYVVDPNTPAGSNVWTGMAINSVTKNGPANPASWIDLPKGFPCEIDSLVLPPSTLADSAWTELESMPYITKDFSVRNDVSYPLRRSEIVVRAGRLAADASVYSGWANRSKILEFIQSGFTPIVESDGSILSFWLSKKGVIYYSRDRRDRSRNIMSVLRKFGTVEQERSRLRRYGIEFDYPKPVDLIRYLISVGGAGSDEIVMDFFAGSGTTGHAVMAANAEDGGSRRYILVQLPEPVESDRFDTIADITRERVRRAGEAIAAEPAKLGQKTRDVGFRSYRLDRSTFSVWDGTDEKGTDEREVGGTAGGNADQHLAPALFVENLRGGTSNADVVTELLLKAGFELTTPVERRVLDGVEVDSVAHGQMLIVTSGTLTLGAFEQMVALEPSLIIVLDRCFGNSDELKVNALQTVRAANRSGGVDIALRVV